MQRSPPSRRGGGASPQGVRSAHLHTRPRISHQTLQQLLLTRAILTGVAAAIMAVAAAGGCSVSVSCMAMMDTATASGAFSHMPNPGRKGVVVRKGACGVREWCGDVVRGAIATRAPSAATRDPLQQGRHGRFYDDDPE
jgi:hypothetical protein